MVTIERQAEQWIIPERNREVEARLQSELDVSALVASVLVRRGLHEPAVADEFLNPSLDRLGDPRLLPDYDLARDAIFGAKERGELIFIHGDYDADGITSAAILDRFLTKIGCKVKTHVPHRMKEGYGIHQMAVTAAHAAGAKLFLTCDCGISAFEPVKMAVEAGMKVVVTDHHHVGNELPAAIAVMNPHRASSQYPFKDLCGAGVVFRLCEGLARELGLPVDKYRDNFLDLAAIGTVADVMPLIGENRIIAHFGLQRLGEGRKAGLRALMKEADIQPPLRSHNIGFGIGPRLNAAGRIDDAALALQLVQSTNDLEATSLAKQIEIVNTQRKVEQQRIVDEAIERVMETGAHEKNVIILADSGWHPGIVGIVAGRLVEQFRRPVFVLNIDEEKGVIKGSGRSIPTFHLAEAILAHPDLFLSGGGHAMAAGCSFEQDRYEEVLETLDAFAGNILSPEDFIPVRRVDGEVEPSEINLRSVQELSKLEPFGMGNPTPQFVARDIDMVMKTPTKSPQHVRLTLRKAKGPAFAAMAFGLGVRMENIEPNTRMDVAFEACVDTWNGRESVKWHVRDYVTTRGNS